MKSAKCKNGSQYAREAVREMLCDQAQQNGDKEMVALLKGRPADDEMPLPLLATYARFIQKTYSEEHGFTGEHVRLCNNYRAVLQCWTGERQKMPFAEAQTAIMNYSDTDLLPILHKYVTGACIVKKLSAISLAETLSILYCDAYAVDAAIKVKMEMIAPEIESNLCRSVGTLDVWHPQIRQWFFDARVAGGRPDAVNATVAVKIKEHILAPDGFAWE